MYGRGVRVCVTAIGGCDRGCLVLVSLLLCLSGCQEPALFPPNAVPFVPPDRYKTWWQLVEQCSGLRGRFEDVRWYTAPTLGVAQDNAVTTGSWFPSGNRIVLVSSVMNNGGVVRHEMLHALRPGPGHPRAYFAEKCGSRVFCDTTCAPSEADRGVPVSAPTLPSMALTVSAVVEPPIPLVSVDSGWFRIVVTATNPNSTPAWINIQFDAPFVFQVENHLRGSRSSQMRRWAFRAFESRAYTFDASLPPGTYTLYGIFSGHQSNPFVFTVAP